MRIQPAKARQRKIEDFIIANVAPHSTDIKSLATNAFGGKRSEIDRCVDRLCKLQILEALSCPDRIEYRIRVFETCERTLPVVSSMAEDEVWNSTILPALDGVAPNVLGICIYGCTEMINNVIDHSGADYLYLSVERNPKQLIFTIWDTGIGIFRKIQEKLQLENRRHAVLELSKGKLTTDPERHTGEGVFYTSRMFDEFTIMSGELFFASHAGDDWLLETDKADRRGTFVTLYIDPRSERTTAGTFARFTSPSPHDDEVRDFSRTHFPVELARFEGESLISRSQAKRLMARAEKFREVVLDFKGVKSIGPSFADEIFRVFKRQHPSIHISTIRVEPEVMSMIRRAIAAAADEDTPETQRP